MTQFQNPLGSLMPDERKRQLVELLTRHDIPLIEDDVYGELYFGATRPVPAKAYDTQGLVLHCSSFSKCLAPGYRIGWASAGRYTQRVQRLKLSSTLSASGPAQGAIAEFRNRAATTVTCAGCATRCRPCRPGWRRRWPMRFPPARA